MISAGIIPEIIDNPGSRIYYFVFHINGSILPVGSTVVDIPHAIYYFALVLLSGNQNSIPNYSCVDISIEVIVEILNNYTIDRAAFRNAHRVLSRRRSASFFEYRPITEEFLP